MKRLCRILLGPIAVTTVLAAHGTAAAQAPATRSTSIRFTDFTDASGIRLSLTSGRKLPREILEVNGGGVALLDYDNDGDLDVFLANGATLGDTELGPGSRLYANAGGGTFTDVTRGVGLKLARWAMGVAVGDYDGDGFDDIYVTCYGPNVLLHNVEGPDGRRFVDVSAEAGVNDARWGSSAAFGDLDADGDLDLYVVNYIEFNVKRPPKRHTFKGVEVFGGPMGVPAQGDVLYENLSDGHFRDVTRTSGVKVPRAGFGLGVVLVDLDSDGRQDIFVGNDSSENFLFRNVGEKGQLKFEEIGVIAGVAANADGRNQATMGIAVSDADGDGLADLFTTNFSSDSNTLHVNLGEGLFDDQTSRYGLAAVSRPFLSWGTGWFDFDSDADEDLFVASGHIYVEVIDNEMDTRWEQPLLMFERKGRRFERTTQAGKIFRTNFNARSVAFGDIDGDGDVDIVMTTLGDRVHVLRNDSPLQTVAVVELEGRGGNRHGLGSRVELVHGDAVQRRWIHGGSYQSVNAPAAYFGLGALAAETQVTLRVIWPDGRTTEHAKVPLDRKVTVARSTDALRSSPLEGR